MCTVEQGEFIHEITERGNIESASNVEIRCEVKSRGSGGTTILEIVPEGTYVEPGDILVKLDASALENELTQQQIVCNNSAAAVTKARNDYETALIAKREYLEGTYIQEEQQIESEIAVANQEFNQAKEYYEYSKRLERKGYVTKLQLEADRFAQTKAEYDLHAAKTKLRVLQEFTKKKQLTQLESNIETAKANLKSQESSYKLDLEQLALVESQVAKCIIHAKEPGQVVYANETNRRGGQEVIIEEGVQVRERQAIIRLPDPKRMQVKANVNEAQISLIEKGQPATIVLDAFPDYQLQGIVNKVNEYPVPSGWFSSNIKEYETTVQILDEDPDQVAPDLKPGLTAQVRILVERLENKLFVPVQAVLEHGNQYYCVLYHDGTWKARKVEIGSTNDTVVVIERGLAPGEEVVLHASAYRDQLDLPKVSPETKNHSPRPGRATPDSQGGPGGPGAAPGNKSPSPGEGPARDSGEPRGDRRGDRPRREQGAPPNPQAMLDGIFKRLDRNGDGRLQQDEWSEQMKAGAQKLDANGDGVIERAELTEAFQRKAGQARPAPPGGKP